MGSIYFKSICEPGNKINEDIAFAGKNIGWVLDAATGLTKEKLTSGDSDGAWFVAQWEEYLKRNTDNMDSSLEDIIYNGIHEVKNKFEDEVKEKKILPVQKPSASIAIIRIKEKIEYLLIGDCTMLVKYKNEEVQKIKDTLLDKLDKKAINEMEKIRKEKNLSFAEAREEINPMLIKHRCLKNTDDGYWTLEFEEEALKHSLTGTLKIEEVSEILLLSDGFASLFESYNYCDEKNIFIENERVGLEKLYLTIREIEERDSDISMFPRFKKGDDASAVYYKINF